MRTEATASEILPQKEITLKLEPEKILAQWEKIFNMLYVARRVTNKKSKLLDEVIPVKLFRVNGNTVEVNKPPYKKHSWKKKKRTWF